LVLPPSQLIMIVSALARDELQHSRTRSATPSSSN
jgi:hypothetical protein